MSDRHLICVFYQGSLVVSQYGHPNGYPEGQGVILLEFLRNPSNIQRLKDGLSNIRNPSEHDLAKAYQQENDLEITAAYARFRHDPDSKWTTEIIDKFCASLSTDTGGHILEVITFATTEKQVPIKLEVGNAPLHFEWAYVVDLDTRKFQVCEALMSNTKQSPNGGGDDNLAAGRSYIFEFSELQMSNEEFLDKVSRKHGKYYTLDFS
jgi:hypothetical protein